jgi:hypothetical protein
VLRADANLMPRKSHSGKWLVVGLFALGLIVLAGLFAARWYFKHHQ